MTQTEDICRLCGGIAVLAFRKPVLLRYDVGYFECGRCGCVQTDPPFWLEEAYAIPGVHIDVGQAIRVVQTWLHVSRLLGELDWPRDSRCLDFGASTGLLARLMRDSGYDFRAFDAYDLSCRYANYFRADDITAWTPDLITAFEVFEHFPQPGESLRALLAGRPRLVVFTTQFWEGQGQEWEYLVPFCGQHVFFYSPRGLAEFAGTQGYGLLRSGDLCFLIRQDTGLYERIARVVSTPLSPEWVGEFVTRTGWGSETTARDFAAAQERFVADLAGSQREAAPGGTASR